MNRPKIIVWQSEKDQQWYWKLVAGNGETQCVSEAYPTEFNAVRGAKDARRNMLWAKVVY